MALVRGKRSIPADIQAAADNANFKQPDIYSGRLEIKKDKVSESSGSRAATKAAQAMPAAGNGNGVTKNGGKAPAKPAPTGARAKSNSAKAKSNASSSARKVSARGRLRRALHIAP
jgi:hypothetical protein